MANDVNPKNAREILTDFFSKLERIEGIDKETAQIIQNLWDEDKLGSNELLSVLDAARNQECEYGKKEA